MEALSSSSVGGNPKKIKLINFLPRNEFIRLRRFGSDTKRSILRRSVGDHSDPLSRSVTSITSNSQKSFPRYSESDNGSVSSISTTPSYFHHRVKSSPPMIKREKDSPPQSPSRSVSSQMSAKHLALEALERESQSSLFSGYEDDFFPEKMKDEKNIGSRRPVLDSDIRSALDMTLEFPPTIPESHRSSSPVPDVYAFRRRVGSELHDISSDSSAEKSRDSTTSTTKSSDASSKPTISDASSKPRNQKKETITSISSNSKKSKNSRSKNDEQVKAKNLVRMKILLMSHSTHLFELISVECPAETVVEDIIAGIIPAKSCFQEQKYIGLCRTVGETEIFDTKLPINVYNINTDEIIIAIPSSQPNEQGKAWTLSDCLARSKAILNTAEKNADNTLKVSNTLESLHLAEIFKNEKSNNETTTISATSWYVFAQVIFVVCSLLLSAAVVSEHLKLITPLKPEDAMHQGEIRSRCGLIGSVIPKTLMNCEPAVIELRSNGILSFYRGEAKELIWEIMPLAKIVSSNKVRMKPLKKLLNSFLKAAADTPEIATTSLKKFSSLYIDFYGDIFINGMKTEIKFYTEDAEEISLSPWPFSLDPNYY